MTVDHTLDCQSHEAIAARALAGTIVAIFPIGVPLALFTQLYTHRHEIMDRETRSGGSELGYIGELGRVLLTIRYHFLSTPPSLILIINITTFNLSTPPPSNHLSVPVSTLPAQVLVHAGRGHLPSVDADIWTYRD